VEHVVLMESGDTAPHTFLTMAFMKMSGSLMPCPL
jgi:hypothetical protein